MKLRLRLLLALVVLAALLGSGHVQAQAEQPSTYYPITFNYQLAREGLDDGSYNCAAHRRTWSQQMYRDDGYRTEAWHNSLWNMECTGVIHLYANLQLGQMVDFWIKPDSWTAVYLKWTNNLCSDPNGCTYNAYADPMYAGDANDDNVVNGADWNIFVPTYGKSCGQTGYDGRAEFTGDCLVNATDYNLIAGNFGVMGYGQLFGPYGAEKAGR